MRAQVRILLDKPWILVTSDSDGNSSKLRYESSYGQTVHRSVDREGDDVPARGHQQPAHGDHSASVDAQGLVTLLGSQQNIIQRVLLRVTNCICGMIRPALAMRDSKCTGHCGVYISKT